MNALTVLKRRKFLILGAMSIGAIFGIASVRFAKNDLPLYDHTQTFTLLLNDLFPPTNGMPSIDQLGSVGHLKRLLNSALLSQESKNYILNGLKWLNESAFETDKKLYYQLDAPSRQALLKDISGYNWGDSWLWTIMSYYFESMFGDPVYGVNHKEAGWNYLHYVPGYPRPEKAYL